MIPWRCQSLVDVVYKPHKELRYSAAFSSNINFSLPDAVLRPRAVAGSWGAAGAAGASEAGATDGSAASEASLLTTALPLDNVQQMSRRSASDFRRTSKRQVAVTVPHMKRICPTKTGLSPTNLQKTAKIYEQAARKYVSQMLEDINMLPAALSSNINFSLPDAVLRPRAVAGSWGAAGAAGASEAGATDGSAASEASLLTTALPLDNVQQMSRRSASDFRRTSKRQVEVTVPHMKRICPTKTGLSPTNLQKTAKIYEQAARKYVSQMLEDINMLPAAFSPNINFSLPDAVLRPRAVAGSWGAAGAAGASEAGATDGSAASEASLLTTALPLDNVQQMSRRSASDFRRTSKRQVEVTVPHMKWICPTKTGLSPTNLQKTAKIYEQAARKYVSQMLEDINMLPAAFSSNINFSLPDAVLRPRAVAGSWGAAGAAGASEAGATDGSAASEASLLTTALPLDNVQQMSRRSASDFRRTSKRQVWVTVPHMKRICPTKTGLSPTNLQKTAKIYEQAARKYVSQMLEDINVLPAAFSSNIIFSLPDAVLRPRAIAGSWGAAGAAGASEAGATDGSAASEASLLTTALPLDNVQQMSRRSASDFRRTSKRQVEVTVPHMKWICPTKTGLSPTNLQKTAKIYEQAARKYVSQMLEDINMLPAAFSSNINFSLPDAVLRPRAVAGSWGAAGAAGASEAGATDGSAASEASLLTTALPLDNVQQMSRRSASDFRRTSKRQVWVTVPHMKRICPTKTGLSPTNLQKTAKIYEQAARKYVSQMLEDINVLPAAFSSSIHFSLPDAVLRPRAVADSWGAAGAAGASEAGATDGSAASEASLLTTALPLDNVQQMSRRSASDFRRTLKDKSEWQCHTWNGYAPQKPACHRQTCRKLPRSMSKQQESMFHRCWKTLTCCLLHSHLTSIFPSWCCAKAPCYCRLLRSSWRRRSFRSGCHRRFRSFWSFIAHHRTALGQRSANEQKIC